MGINKTDVIIVGAGIAGLTASIRASEMGADVDLISPDFSERSQSVMAMGGINASLNTKGQDDSPQQHFKDTMNSGCWINNEKAVLKLTSNTPEIIAWLEKLGTSFTRDMDGNVDLRYFGGQKKRRTAYAGARTGKQIVTSLVNECRKREVEGRIRRFTSFRFDSLIFTDKKECIGVSCTDENTLKIRQFTGDAVIIATGGMNKLFGRTSGSLHNDGYATAKAFIQGVELANLEMIQYHPTTVKTPMKRMLITEAARGEGGKLFILKDGRPWYFMKEWYPEQAELMPRDVVSRSIYKASDAGKKEVYLDITHLDENTIKTKLDEVYEICMTYLDLNPVKEPIPVMGGIRTDENHKTNIKGLYAAGECSCQYHGANRLGGNSLLGAVHGGWIAAENAILEKPEGNIVNEKVILHEYIENQIAEILTKSMGIYRNEDELNEALKELDRLDEDAMTILAKACILSALKRRESRGAHQRSDYPQSSDEFRKSTCAEYDGEIKISFKGCQ